MPTNGPTPPAGRVEVSTPGSNTIHYITRVADPSGAIIPSFSFDIDSYLIHDDDTVSYVRSWETLVIVSGVVSWQDHTPGEVLPPTAIVTGHDTDGTPYFSAKGQFHGENRLGMFNPNKTYALMPYGEVAKHINKFAILLFHKGTE